MSASDAPQPQAGVRTRSGNAMLRTRAAILEAAAATVQEHGVRRTTMAKVAVAGGIAKATLYNHFRTKEDVLAALVDGQVAALGEQCATLAAQAGLVAALEHAAVALASSAPLRKVAAEEPDLLLPLLVPDDGRGWREVRTTVVAVLEAARCSPDHSEAVLRWLVSQLLWPAAPGSAAAVVRALGPAQGASAAPAGGRGRGSVQPAGLGWPG